MNTNIQEAHLKYPKLDKQAYATFKAINHFRSYPLKKHTAKVIVPHLAMRSLFV